mmetsp:Transcript_7374/g.19047  ORF Transcript_7374/g.19047 Transcript_7374/m.19047 type:complete len:269 (+) Transcript_7374:419-1225(+)
MSMAEAKDAEVGKLLESNAKLREELAASHTRQAHPSSSRSAEARSGGAPPRPEPRGAPLLSEPLDEDGQEWHRWSTGGGLEDDDDAAADGAEGAKPAELLEEMLDGMGGLSMMNETSNQLLQIAQRQAQRDDQMADFRQRVAELEEEVTDLRKEVALREEQEMVLKEALRETQRTEQRKQTTQDDVDMEYLKNVVVQLCCTRQQEALLPVVAQVLHLSPTEVAKCREAMARYRQEAEPDIVGAASEYISSSWGLPDWFGGGGGAAAST